MTWVAAGMIVLLLPAAGLAWLSFSAKRPSTLGLTEGRLADCPDTPNCVTTLTSREDQFIEPLRLGNSKPDDKSLEEVSQEAIGRLAAVLASFPRAKVVRKTNDYLHAEFSSRLFGFVDDVEFHVDAANGVIQCRSASRVGKSDLGVNRQRIELIREAWRNGSEHQ